jgi:hypothetical protein
MMHGFAVTYQELEIRSEGMSMDQSLGRDHRRSPPEITTRGAERVRVAIGSQTFSNYSWMQKLFPTFANGFLVQFFINRTSCHLVLVYKHNAS